jgi:hypothetical protein
MINTPRYRFMAMLEQKVLAERDPDRAIELAELFALVMHVESPDRYEASEIERHVISLFLDVQLDEVPQKRNQTLHVITTPYAIGGHTRLMENLASAEEVAPCLLVTGEYTEQALLRSRTIFEDVFFVSRKDRAKKRVHDLLQVMAQFDHLVLHIHLFDIATVVACLLANKFGCKVYFVNHGDNLFSFGNTVADVWFQLGVNGAKIDEKRKLRARLAFLGVASGSSADFERVNHDCRPVRVIASAGAAYKFRPLDGDRSYFQLVERLLEKYPDAKFYALGVTPFRDFWWWLLKLRFWSRISLKRSMPFDDYIKFMEAVDLYVDSYPYHGGTAFSQQLAKGKCCIGLLTKYEGYSPAEQLKHTTVADVLAALDKPLSALEQDKIIKQTILVNSQEAVAERYRSALCGDVQKLDKESMGLIDVPRVGHAEICLLSSKYSANFLYRMLRADSRVFLNFFACSKLTASVSYIAKFGVDVLVRLLALIRK